MTDDPIKAAAKLLGAAGGRARAETLTPAQRAAIARKAGKASTKGRMAKLSPEERSEIARRAAIRRWNRRK